MGTAPFDLDAFMNAPRLLGLLLSPDGTRLALTVQTVAASGRRFESSIWEVPTAGGEPRLLTEPGGGETARGFLPDGSLLLTAPRRSEAPPSGRDEARPDEGEPPRPPDALYVARAGDPERRTVVAPDAGAGQVLTARSSPTVVVTAAMHPGAVTLADDAERERARTSAGIQARLVDHYPDRYWDHDIGPRQPRLLALDVDAGAAGAPEPRDLTPSPNWAGWLEDADLSIAEDGLRVAFACNTQPGARLKKDLAVVDTSGEGAVRVVVDDQVSHGPMAWSPDGATIAAAATDVGSPDQPPRFHLRLVDAATGATREVGDGWDLQVHELVWTRDGGALLVTADERGHTPIFRVTLDGTLTRLTAAGAYHDLAAAPDGTTLYAIRSHINEAPVPVRLDAATADQVPEPLPSPVPEIDTGTRLEEVTVQSAGAEIHSWLVLPAGAPAEPLPLAVLVHGGPVSSWAGWHWRWSAPLVAAHGWAVLLPNPRLSTGYGYDHIAAAWTDWATLPAGDVMASVDAVVARPDVDAARTAALGGSYGGYMANWLAVTTDRFRGIVTHASVWDLELERNASDVGFDMDREFGSPQEDGERWRLQSPSRRADQLGTPMLVIHGSRDARVPIAQAHSLWTELQTRGVPSRLLAYPDENHWILKPQNARLWYQAVFAFLDEHVLGRPWGRPPLV